MTITNGYATLAQLKAELAISVSDTTTDTKLETAIAAASRQIDGFCARRFWQDGTVQVRTYYAGDEDECWTDDISTTTGLIVKVDYGNDGSFSTTLTVSTDYLLHPLNALSNTPARPYECIRTTENGQYFPEWDNRPSVQVTAKFGWPAVPDDVTKACLTQAAQLYKASDAPFGGISFGDGSVVRVRSALNPIAAALLEPYVRQNLPMVQPE